MSSEWTIQTSSEEQTRDFGKKLGAAAEPGDVVALSGPLGAGKTQLTKGIAEGAGVVDPRMVNSPTFVIINEYKGRLDIYHIDAYRLGEPEELLAIGLEEMYDSDGLIVIEWADKISPLLPQDHLAIALKPCDECTRTITLRAGGTAWQRRIDLLRSRHVKT